MTWRLKATREGILIATAGAALSGLAAIALIGSTGWPRELALVVVAGVLFAALLAVPLEVSLAGVVTTSFLSPYFLVLGLHVRLDEVLLLAATVRFTFSLLHSRRGAPGQLRSFITYWGLAWVASAFVSWIVGSLLPGATPSWRDMLIIVTRVELLAMILVTVVIDWDEQRIWRLFTYVIFASFFVTLLGLGQALHIGPVTALIARFYNKLAGAAILIPTWDRITATMDAEPNVFGNFLAVVVAFQFALIAGAFKKYWWVLPITLLNIGLVVMNASRSSLFAVALGLVVILLLRRRAILPVAALGLVLVLLLGLGVRLPALTAYRLQPVIQTITSGQIQDAGLSSRIFMWNRDIQQLLRTNLLFGIGPSVQSLILSDSEYVELALKYGLLGLMLHFALLVWLLRGLPYTEPGRIGTVSLGLIAAVVGLMFASLTGIYFYSPRIVAVFLPLAVAIASWKGGVARASKALQQGS